MSERLRSLAATFASPQESQLTAGEELIEVSAPASTAASFYEKVRTAVDYQEEHLLRRNAILRILKRFLGSDLPIEKMAHNLLKELIWAKYLPNKEVPTNFAKKLVPIFAKYEPLLRAVDEDASKKDEAFFWVLDVMSTELEYALTPPIHDEALVSYMYEEMRGRIFWDPKLAISDEHKDLRLYIAIHKILLKSNIATLRFRVLTLYYPDWPGASTSARVEEIAGSLDHIIETIEGQLQNPVTVKLALLLRRKAGVFRVVHDVLLEKADELPELLEDPEKLDREVAKYLKKRTKSFKIKLRRTVLRAVLFLFITKMLLALILEVPYDFLILKETSVLPLAINVLFHPLFLAFIGMTVTIPEKRNSVDYISTIRGLVVGADHDLLNIRVKRESFGTWGKIFSFVYALMFLFTYGVLATILINIHFNWLSISLFLFFISLVTFFGIRIRTSTKDIVLSNARSGLFGSMFDVFMLPIVRAGRWLSFKVSKINIFIYFFDFIIESPLKVALKFIEGWVAFIREKKEEI
jgi:hypothetical protein